MPVNQSNHQDYGIYSTSGPQKSGPLRDPELNEILSRIHPTRGDSPVTVKIDRGHRSYLSDIESTETPNYLQRSMLGNGK
jgi:hypothetical protein